ncbi:MAG: hypothetical protein KIC86_05035 [Sutterella sp.]|jgi:hypothetical protein|nr:hypothetical protein [Sutterella sp.]
MSQILFMQHNKLSKADTFPKNGRHEKAPVFLQRTDMAVSSPGLLGWKAGMLL